MRESALGCNQIQLDDSRDTSQCEEKPWRAALDEVLKAMEKPGAGRRSSAAVP